MSLPLAAAALRVETTDWMWEERGKRGTGHPRYAQVAAVLEAALPAVDLIWDSWLQNKRGYAGGYGGNNLPLLVDVMRQAVQVRGAAMLGEGGGGRWRWQGAHA